MKDAFWILVFVLFVVAITKFDNFYITVDEYSSEVYIVESYWWELDTKQRRIK